jgi:preprotein translocase subunit SecY
MARYKIAIFTLIAVLVISLGFNVYQYGANQTATQENQSAQSREHAFCTTAVLRTCWLPY